MESLGRNDKCWCGSGRKFKKCHLDREQQQPDNPWAAVEQNQKSFKVKKCFAHSVGLGSCGGGIIKAHTISSGPNLKKIAINGKVLGYDAHVSELKKTNGNLIPKLIGVGNASVFYGFCADHDRDLFSCIENEKFVGGAKQCLTVAYRTLSRELYTKQAATNLRETLRDADKGKGLNSQQAIQKMLDASDYGNKMASKEIQRTHDALTKALVEEDFNDLRSIVIECEGPIPFMCSGAWTPITDLLEKPLQDGISSELLDQIFFSTFHDDNGSRICLSWLDKDDAPGKVIADQICKLNYTSLLNIVFQFLVKFSENIFFKPDWFDGLDQIQSRKINVLAMVGANVGSWSYSSAINHSMNFGFPAVRAIFSPTS